MRVMIADDHQIVRAGVGLILGSLGERVEIEESSSFAMLQEKLSGSHYDLLILDLNLGDKNGIYTIQEVNHLYPDLPTLVLSMHPENPYAIQSIQAGAKGYLNKTVLSENLIEAVKRVSEGTIYLTKAYQETLPFGTKLTKCKDRLLESLSQREYEVYMALSEGLCFSKIAKKLDISPKTVSTYRTRILEKLSLGTTEQLVAFALLHPVKD